MDIDEQLLNKNKDFDELEKAGEFRASLRQPRQLEPDPSTDFRQQVRARQGLKISTEKRAGEIIHRDSPIRKLTDKLLQGAWQNLLPSWGLTLRWIDTHVFFNKVFGPKVFRELGEEWIPAGLKKLGDEKGKQAVSLIKVLERSGCGCLNIGCLFLILGILVIISIIADPLGFGLDILSN
jgi:hypothetical protein